MSKKKKQNNQHNAGKGTQKRHDIFSTMKTLHATRYTYKSWMKCYPESNREEWEMISNPSSVLDFIAMTVSNMEKQTGRNLDDLPITLVTLDEEYFKWLGNRKNTTERRVEYAQITSDKDAVRLAKKNGMNHSYTVCAYPMVILPEEHKNRELTKETQLEFINYLKQISPKSDVYVVPELLHIQEVDKREDEFVKIARKYFNTGHDTKLEKWDVEKSVAPMVDLYAIPVVFRETHDTATFTFNDLVANDDNVLYRDPAYIEMNMDFFKEFNVRDVKPFVKSDVLRWIKKDLKMTDIPNKEFKDFFIDVCDIQEEYEGFLEEIEEDERELLKKYALIGKNEEANGLQWRQIASMEPVKLEQYPNKYIGVFKENVKDENNLDEMIAAVSLINSQILALNE